MRQAYSTTTSAPPLTKLQSSLQPLQPHSGLQTEVRSCTFDIPGARSFRDTAVDSDLLAKDSLSSFLSDLSSSNSEASARPVVLPSRSPLASVRAEHRVIKTQVKEALADFKSANTSALNSPRSALLSQIQQLRREVNSLSEGIAIRSTEEPSTKLTDLVAHVVRHPDLRIDQTVSKTQCQSCNLF